MIIHNKDTSKTAISKLVENFATNISKIKSSTESSEAQIEDVYVKPLFSFLNWNIHNLGLSHGKEVFVVQYHIKRIGKRPDYLLRIPDAIKNKMKHMLFMEAKHPRYNLLSRHQIHVIHLNYLLLLGCIQKYPIGHQIYLHSQCISNQYLLLFFY